MTRPARIPGRSDPTPSASPAALEGTSRRHVALSAVAVALFALLLRLPFLSDPGYGPDQLQFLVWAQRMADLGLPAAYDARPDDPARLWCNYPPLYLFILRGLAAIHPAVAGRPLDEHALRDFVRGDDPALLARTSALLKLPAVLADAALGAILVVILARRRGLRGACAVAGVYAALPCVLYDSAVWGQVDGLLALLLVASLEFARRGRLAPMAGTATLALLTKPQAVMLLPVWLAVAIAVGGRRPRSLGAAAIVSVVCVVVILAPFASALDGVWHAYAGAAAYYPYTHLNGFSLWFLRHPLDAPDLARMSIVYPRDDAAVLGPLTPRILGLSAVLAAWLAAFVALARAGRAPGPGTTTQSIDKPAPIDFAAMTLPLAFFLFSTQMHERYLLPALATWAWAYHPQLRWWAGLLLLAYGATANLLWAWPGPADGPVNWTALLPGDGRLLGAPLGTACAAIFTIVMMYPLLGMLRAARRDPPPVG